MIEAIRAHVEALFAGRSDMDDLKEELLSNCIDKYNDISSRGVSGEEAFRAVVAGIGNIDELLGTHDRSSNYDLPELRKDRAKKAFLQSISVGLYFLSFALMILLERWSGPGAFCAMLVTACGATMVMVYARHSGLPPYVRQNDSFVEAYKEQVSGDTRDKELKKAVSGALWPVTALLYLGLSFYTKHWHITWVIFILAAGVQSLIFMLLSQKSNVKERRRALQGALWTLITAVYFLTSFLFNIWPWSWMIFIFGICLQQMLHLFHVWKES